MNKPNSAMVAYFNLSPFSLEKLFFPRKLTVGDTKNTLIFEAVSRQPKGFEHEAGILSPGEGAHGTPFLYLLNISVFFVLFVGNYSAIKDNGTQMTQMIMINADK
ncbi:MAG: hypothetical protein QX199_02190 [Methylococcaceae bacterium]